MKIRTIRFAAACMTTLAGILLCLFASADGPGQPAPHTPVRVQTGGEYAAADSVRSIIAEGTCGENVTWTIYSDGVLSVTGTGTAGSNRIDDYPDGTAPWLPYTDYPYNYDQITSVEIDNVTAIGAGAFSGIHYIQTVSLPDGLTEIGDEAFKNCRRLTEIHIPDSVTRIGRSSFSGCTILQDIEIGSAVEHIESYAFQFCRRLRSVYIPANVLSVGYGAFSSCSELEEFSVAGENPSYASRDGMLYDKSLETLVTFPMGKTIDAVIPDGTKVIGSLAFLGNNRMVNLFIPGSLTGIDDGSFRECGKITGVYYKGTELQWNRISIGSGNESLLNADVHFSSAYGRPASALSLSVSGELTLGEEAAFEISDAAGADYYEAVFFNSDNEPVMRETLPCSELTDGRHILHITPEKEDGWTAGEYTLKVHAVIGAKTDTAAYGIVRIASTNMREGPSSYCRVIKQVGASYAVTELEILSDSGEIGGYTWYKVRCQDLIGYIRGDMLKIVYSKEFSGIYTAASGEISFTVLENESDDIPIDAVHFPDESFRRFVSEEHIDRNRDGVLSAEERAAVTAIRLDEEGGYRIRSLKGVENFRRLSSFVCIHNPIAEVNLSYNNNLRHIEFIDCTMDSINITGCPLLLEAVRSDPVRIRVNSDNPIHYDSIAGLLFDSRTTVIAGDLVFPATAASAAAVTEAPAARILIYNGQDQELIIPGSASGGYLVYSTDGPYTGYSENIPEAAEAGEYTIFYRVYGDDGHYPSDPQSITARIESADPRTFEPRIPETLTVPPKTYLITDGRMLYPYVLSETDGSSVLNVTGTPYEGSFTTVYDQTGDPEFSVYEIPHFAFVAGDVRVMAFYRGDGSLRDIQIETEIITDPENEISHCFRYVFSPDGRLFILENMGGIHYFYDFETRAWRRDEDTPGESEAVNGGLPSYLIKAPVNLSLNRQSPEHAVLLDLTPDIILPADTASIADEAFAGIQNLFVRVPDSVKNISDTAFDPSVVILCSADSRAREWAEANGIVYIPVR